jgi:hypothetical protein
VDSSVWFLNGLRWLPLPPLLPLEPRPDFPCPDFLGALRFRSALLLLFESERLERLLGARRFVSWLAISRSDPFVLGCDPEEISFPIATAANALAPNRIRRC